MAKARKAKISDKTLDVLQKTKKAPSKSKGSSKRSSSNAKDEPRTSRSRSRSMSRTPARPPKSTAKSKPKKQISKKKADSRSRSPPAKSKSTTPKPKAKPTKAKAAPKKIEPKRVGKEQPGSSQRRAGTPKERVRRTPTRQSKRISSIYNSIPDTKDSGRGSSPKSNHFGNSKSSVVDRQSISSNSPSKRGWFSNCVIV